MSKKLPAELPDESRGEFLLYQSKGDGQRLEVRLHDESVWLSLNQLTRYFSINSQADSFMVEYQVFTRGHYAPR